MSHGGEGDSFGGATTPEDSVKAGEKVVRISYHRRMYGLGEVSCCISNSELTNSTTIH